MEITDKKCGLLSKQLFQRTQQHDGCSKLLGNDKYVEKIFLPIITWNIKRSLNQVASVIYTLRKEFLSALLLKVCETFVFRQSKKA